MGRNNPRRDGALNLGLIYPQVFTIRIYNDSPKLCPQKAHKLSEKRVIKMRNWRGNEWSEFSLENSAKYDNKGQSSI